MDESFAAPIGPPPRHKSKPGKKYADSNSFDNSLPIQESVPESRQISSSEVAEGDALTDLEDNLDEYLADKIEAEEMGEACELHLPGMLDGIYIDPFTVPAKYLIEQEFKRLETVVEEFTVLLEQNKKRTEEKAKQDSQH